LYFLLEGAYHPCRSLACTGNGLRPRKIPHKSETYEMTVSDWESVIARDAFNEGRNSFMKHFELVRKWSMQIGRLLP